MVFVLKPPVDGSKGILVFTHKERSMLHPNLPFVSECLDAVKQRYVVGMHWGAFQENVLPLESMEFHMSGPGTVVWKQPPKVPHYHLCSRNFLSPVFRQLPDVEKKWDILAVTNFRRLKNTRQLFRVLKNLLQVRPGTTALIVCACASRQDLNPMVDDLELEADYQALFTEGEREQVQLLVKESKKEALFSQEELALLYNQSRVFTLFSDVEGESRVVSEASLCGLPVVVKSWLKGGGRDYLTPGNSRQFDRLEEAHSAFLELLEAPGCGRFDPVPLRQELCETYTSAKLRALMAALFESKGVPFEGECDLVGLANKLPGHVYLTLPEQWRYSSSNDFNSPVSAVQYLASLSGMEVPAWKKGVLQSVWRYETMRKELKMFFKKPGRKLREWKLLPPKRSPLILGLS